jgi:beta-1,4-mannosyl-glycoprotein beta-1,4-N-acetylglucosaminyltransferase
MKIIDGFTFYNELGMLKYRLTLLYPIIDYFILVEATTTHVGNKKELYYQNNKEQFAEFQDKIIHIVVDDMPNSENSWDREKHQRRCISRGFSKIQMNDDDILIISDLDEIPNPETILKLKDTGISTLSSLKQHLYYYNLTTYVTDSWLHPVVLTYKQLTTEYNGDTNCVRGNGNGIIENGGWHLSYFGNENFISNKLKNFAHTEFSSDNFTDLNTIQFKVQRGECVFDSSVKFNIVPLDKNMNLPPNYELLFEFLSMNS